MYQTINYCVKWRYIESGKILNFLKIGIVIELMLYNFIIELFLKYLTEFSKMLPDL